ncbi:hypothetical protein BpHYR1_008250 [Brachionus plicatilis]|uniref:Uncharacterized protein n=1 Tax=Brachionus plicatilis TaxID=10195 RepID=A0A3M7SBM0_BRAPC|nr:hypothetical protein BpHYR1_008250 [Brachionus plicatilis]
MGSNVIPTLTLNNQDFKTDEEKGKLFGKILSSTFSLNSDLENTEKDTEITHFNLKYFKNNSQLIFNEPISLNEMIIALKLKNCFNENGILNLNDLKYH